MLYSVWNMDFQVNQVLLRMMLNWTWWHWVLDQEHSECTYTFSQYTDSSQHWLYKWLLLKFVLLLVLPSVLDEVLLVKCPVSIFVWLVKMLFHQQQSSYCFRDWRLVMCTYSKFRIESNSYFSIRFDSKRVQIFEIFEYLPSPISYLFKQNDADFSP